MSKIRVLSVDDSALMRQIMTEIINSHSDMEMVATAPDPLVARDLIKKFNPDVLTLDVEMPRMDGLDFLEKLMRLRPMPVVMVSSLTGKGSEVTLRALELGAIDFVTKPQLGIREGMLAYSEMIAEKVRTAAKASLAAHVVQMTAQAAERALNSVEASQPHQDQMEKSAKALTQRWDDWFADPIDLADARELVTDTRQFLADVPAHTSFTNAQLLEIMMAQDFQDLTGQVIKRMMDVIQEIERQLLMVLLENIPEQESRPKRENQSLLNGPQVDTSKAGVVASQDQVDDLLDSLGF